jgi:FkbM family methyltransferase
MIKEYDGELYDYIGNDIKNELVFDIGSNIGQMTKRFVNKGCKVIAVEPLKELVNNDNYKGVYKIENTCIGNYVGEISFYKCEKHQSSSCLSFWGKMRHPDKTVKEITVPITTLDELIKKYGVPKYIKIDVEGNEDKLFEGLSTKIDLISFEFVNNFTHQTFRCIEILQNKFGFKKLLVFMKRKIKKIGKGTVRLAAYTVDITDEKYRNKFFTKEFKELIKKANRDVADILVIM